MKLTKIKDTVCPVCGSFTESEVRKNKHTNGSWNEYRTFACGLTLHFVPNFMKVRREGICRESKKYKKAVAKNAAAKAKLMKYIDKLDADIGFIADIKSRIQFV
jgi:hypothetical protein